MRRFISILLFFGCIILTYADKVPMFHEHGVYKINVHINDAVILPFVVDSGAATILLPPDVFTTLLRSGTITKDDIIEEGIGTSANGTRNKILYINLRKISIGGKTFHNIKAAVIDTLDGDLLLGQSALRKLEPYRLDTRKNVFYFKYETTQNQRTESYQHSSSPSEAYQIERILNTDVGYIQISKPIFSQDSNIILKIQMKSKLTNARGGLSISFPQFQESSFIMDSLQKNFDSLNYYPKDSKIYSSVLGRKIFSKYLMVEGWKRYWNTTGTNSIVLKLNVQDLPKELIVLVRGVLISDNTEYKIPEEGYVGQQGYYNYVLHLPIKHQNKTNDSFTNQSPTDFIISYFEKIKHVPYIETWNMLSKHMQNQTSYDKYVNWWDSQVSQVNATEVTDIGDNKVEIKLIYHMKNGKIFCSLDRFTLEQKNNQWYIYNQTYKRCKTTNK